MRFSFWPGFIFFAAVLSGCSLGLERDALLFVLSGGREGGGSAALVRPGASAPRSDRRTGPSRPAPEAPGERCEGDLDPDWFCLALRYVVYRNSDGSPVESGEEVSRRLEDANRIWRECGIRFQVDRYEAVIPSEYGLRFRTAEYWEFEEIRRRFRTDDELLVVRTGEWDRSKSFRGSWVSAWTNLPGEPNLGAILERDAGGNANILAHELGHYLSLEHSADAGDLMHPILFPRSRELTREQCSAARWAIHVFWKRMLR